jgi:hypothetical protein
MFRSPIMKFGDKLENRVNRLEKQSQNQFNPKYMKTKQRHGIQLSKSTQSLIKDFKEDN